MFSEEQNKKLQQLREALDAGILTKEEYDKKVKEVAPIESENKPLGEDGFYHYGETKPPLKEQNTAAENPQQQFGNDNDGVVYFRENSNPQTQGNAQQPHTNPQPQGNAQQPHTNPQPQSNAQRPYNNTQSQPQQHVQYQNYSAYVPPQKPIKQKKNIFGKFKEFWNRNKRNKVLTIIGSILALVILIGIVGNIGSHSHESYEWPDNDMAKMLPEPEGTITYLSTSEGSYLSADVKADVDSYKEYVKACKEKGFTEEKDSSQLEESRYYSAKNSDAYSLSVNYDGDEKEMSISLDAPEEETEATQETASQSSGTDVSADFKSTMDSYESFMNKYVDFMKKYENSSDTTSMLSEYTEMMQEYSDFAAKIDAIDEDSLSTSDYAYYMEVMTRVNKKLLEVAD